MSTHGVSFRAPNCAIRHHPHGVMPLEVWDVLVDDVPLYLLPQAEQPAGIAELARQLQAGRARRLRDSIPLPQLTIDQVVLAGGGCLTSAQTALQSAGFDARLAPEPVWIGEAGGQALLAGLCEPGAGAVLDVGQTSLKYSFQARRRRLVRPLEQVPLELDARDPVLQPRARANTVAFIASAFADTARPAAIVMALPCEIDDALHVAGCSYPWLAGDPTLVADILITAELADTPCLVLNDAELAALSVQLTHPHRGATLVLTVGLGVGAAYLFRAD